MKQFFTILVILLSFSGAIAGNSGPALLSLECKSQGEKDVDIELMIIRSHVTLTAMFQREVVNEAGESVYDYGGYGEVQRVDFQIESGFRLFFLYGDSVASFEAFSRTLRLKNGTSLLAYEMFARNKPAINGIGLGEKSYICLPDNQWDLLDSMEEKLK
tara:strand:+ start:3862 stop:4338 length:477 start_codon:yes stop_codon:yes gene_type:complete